MSVLTTRQRDLLKSLLESPSPKSASQLADEFGLTARQVTYDLKGLKGWLKQRDVALKVTPGTGAELTGTLARMQALLKELSQDSDLQLVLTAEQRQQLLALVLLTADEPYILLQLQKLIQVSRTTVLKDLDAVGEWAASRNVELKRRPNYGIWMDGDERVRRMGIAQILWGECKLGESLFQLDHAAGLTFTLAEHAQLLPVVKSATTLLKELELAQAFGQVAHTEAQLDGRFTDDAVLFLSLVFSIQGCRIRHGRQVDVETETIEWLKTLAVWQAAAQMAKRLGWRHNCTWSESEIAYTAMHLLGAPRNERWPGDLEMDQVFADLIDDLMNEIGQAYQMPNLSQDSTLRDGLVNHVVPTTMRCRFQLWMPTSLSPEGLSGKYEFENDLARRLTEIVAERTQMTLPDREINNLALLLRAAFIRERPQRIHEVIVVCPSGMATAQLLMARLRARIPRLGKFTVVSLRELTVETVAEAELIISTVPLNVADKHRNKVIQVHPLLLPEDVKSITQWLA